MRPMFLLVLAAVLCSGLVFGQAPSNKAAANPTATPVPTKADPLNLTEVEIGALDTNQKQQASLNEDKNRIQIALNEASRKIQEAKNVDQMASAGYQMRDALLEDVGYRGRLTAYQQATETLVQTIRRRYQEQTGQDCSACTINLDTRRLQPAPTVSPGAPAAPSTKPK